MCRPIWILVLPRGKIINAEVFSYHEEKNITFQTIKGSDDESWMHHTSTANIYLITQLNALYYDYCASGPILNKTEERNTNLAVKAEWESTGSARLVAFITVSRQDQRFKANQCRYYEVLVLVSQAISESFKYYLFL